MNNVVKRSVEVKPVLRKCKVPDSCGKARQYKTPQAAKDELMSRKQACGTDINRADQSAKKKLILSRM